MRIILDLDDTLNTFTMTCLNLYGFKCRPWDWYLYPAEAGYDMCSAIQRLTGKILNAAYFWQTLPLSVWSDCPKSLECDWLVDLAFQLVGPENVLIATSPTLDHESLGAKVKWIEANLPKELHRQYAITPRKKPWIGGLLVDDCPRWEPDVLMPRPWNAAGVLPLAETKRYVEARLTSALN